MQTVTNTEKCLSAISYLPFFVLVSLVLERKKVSSDFLLFHVNRGFVLFIVECCIFLPLAVLAYVLGIFWYPIGTVVHILMFLLALVFLFLSVYGIALSLRAKMKDIPIFNKCTPFKK